jgi:hypothetical protein
VNNAARSQLVLGAGNIRLLLMATISYVTPQEHAAALLRIERLEKLLVAYIQTQEEWLDTAAALRATGIKARSTLVQFARATAPGAEQEGRITYRKEGTKCLYARSSCIDYRQRRHDQSTLRN